MKPNQITGKKIKDLRESLGMSQKDFGEELGVCERIVRYKENGGKEVDRLIAYAIIGLKLVYRGKK